MTQRGWHAVKFIIHQSMILCFYLNGQVLQWGVHNEVMWRKMEINNVTEAEPRSEYESAPWTKQLWRLCCRRRIWVKYSLFSINFLVCVSIHNRLWLNNLKLALKIKCHIVTVGLSPYSNGTLLWCCHIWMSCRRHRVLHPARYQGNRIHTIVLFMMLNVTCRVEATTT